MADRYQDLGPEMKKRLDAAEAQAAKMKRWVAALAQRGPVSRQLAWEFCVVMDWPEPAPYQKKSGTAVR